MTFSNNVTPFPTESFSRCSAWEATLALQVARSGPGARRPRAGRCRGRGEVGEVEVQRCGPRGFQLSEQSKQHGLELACSGCLEQLGFRQVSGSGSSVDAFK